MRRGSWIAVVVAVLFVVAACGGGSEDVPSSVESPDAPLSGISVATPTEQAATEEPRAATSAATPKATATQAGVAPTRQAQPETTPVDQPAQTASTTTSVQASSDQASGGQVSVETTSDVQLSPNTTVGGQISGTIAAPSDVGPTPTQLVDHPTPAATESSAPALAVGTNVGELAPDFQLPAASGSDRSLASYRGDKNVLVVFYRAFF
jgi:hypothetical protein